MLYKQGTVGKPLPGIKVAIDKIEGIENGGKLVVSGPNIMMGYYLESNPGVITFPEYTFNDLSLNKPSGKWYDTGDIVEIDNEGYIKIVDRVKRFAKIGGEMISLMAVEGYIMQLHPEFTAAIVAISDERKGEQLVLVTNNHNFSKIDLTKHFRASGYPEIALPKYIFVLDELPLLGTGKVNYLKLKEFVLNSLTPTVKTEESEESED